MILYIGFICATMLTKLAQMPDTITTESPSEIGEEKSFLKRVFPDQGSRFLLNLLKYTCSSFRSDVKPTVFFFLSNPGDDTFDKYRKCAWSLFQYLSRQAISPVSPHEGTCDSMVLINYKILGTPKS